MKSSASEPGLKFSWIEQQKDSCVSVLRSRFERGLEERCVTTLKKDCFTVDPRIH